MDNENPAKDIGRPRIELNWEQVNECARIGCTGEEIASILGCSYDTLERRVKETFEMPCAEYLKSQRGEVCASLRRTQLRLALKGDRTMLIWLGKQLLGQKEPSQHVELDNRVTTDRDMTDEEFRAEIEGRGLGFLFESQGGD